LLNGKGEIKDVELNCALLNQELLKITPFVQLDRIQISRLSFHVDSWTNLRKAPIHVDIEHITAQLSEPFHYVDVASGDRSVLRQVTVSELTDLIQQGVVSKLRTASYNLLDRIVDNISVEIKSLSITFQPVGKFKTRCVGPWTPPAILLQLHHLKWCSVNELGQEDTADNVWRHNEQQQQQQPPRRTTRKDPNNNSNDSNNNSSFLICKKLECYYQVSLITGDATTVVPIVSCRAAAAAHNNNNNKNKHTAHSKLEVQVAMQRRVRDGAYLAVQVDVSLPLVDVEIVPTTVPLLAHFIAALQYCLAKDRSYSDPLKSSAGSMLTNGGGGGEKVVPQQPPPRKKSEDAVSLSESSTTTELMVVTEATTTTIAPELLAAAILGQASFSDGSGDDDAENSMVMANDDENDDNGVVDDDATRISSSQRSQPQLDTRPVLITPNGLIIHEKVAVNVCILRLEVRCLYNNNNATIDDDDDDNGGTSNSSSSMIVSANGLVAEVIWPKVTQVHTCGMRHTLYMRLTVLYSIRKREVICKHHCRFYRSKKCGDTAHAKSWWAVRHLIDPGLLKRHHNPCARSNRTNPFPCLKLDRSGLIRCTYVEAFPNRHSVVRSR
jgi:hypothetical protein